LVIHLDVANRPIHRILIDTGSAVEVLFAEPYQRLGMPEASLLKVATTLYGFTGEPADTLGATDLSVTIGPETHNVRFAVVRARSAYNAILGRGFLSRLEAVPSTAHSALKFISHGGKLVVIRGDQAAAVQCVHLESQLQRVASVHPPQPIPAGVPSGMISPHILPDVRIPPLLCSQVPALVPPTHTQALASASLPSTSTTPAIPPPSTTLPPPPPTVIIATTDPSLPSSSTVPPL
jgi:hypothetical protein